MARNLVGTTDSAWCGKIRLAECDALPGRYYVTARNERGQTAFLVGPFTQTTLGQQGHARALGALRRAKEHVLDNYPRSMGWTFGTARLSLYGSSAPVGKLNEIVGAL